MKAHEHTITPSVASDASDKRNPARTKSQQRARRKAGKKAKRITELLGEKNPSAFASIAQLARLRSPEFLDEVYQETLAQEEAGGLLVKDGSRRRSPGGVFLHLAKQKLTPRERAAMWAGAVPGREAGRRPEAVEAEQRTAGETRKP